LFDQWGIPYTRVEASEIVAGDLNAKYDVMLFADDNPNAIVGSSGGATPSPYAGASYPPEYNATLGETGLDSLREFVRNGGHLVLLDGATGLATERFGIPVRNPLLGLDDREFFVPGSTLRVQMDTSHPLAYGMPDEALIVFFESAAFDISNSSSNDQISVVAEYGDRDLMKGGWLDGEQHLANQAALVDVGYGMGRIALIGFRAQNRAQAHGTFKVLFNALYEGGATNVSSSGSVTRR
jgi:hypothetical protein